MVCTYQLLDNSLDQVGKVQPLVGLRVVDVLAENGDGLGISVGVEAVSTLLEDELDLLVCREKTSPSRLAVSGKQWSEKRSDQD